MGKDSSIQWTDHTWPVTTGCDDESPGCLNCYSKPASYRMGLNPNPKIAAAYSGTTEKRNGVVRWTGLLKTHPDRLDWPFKWRKPAKVFVGNMSDLFHPEVPDDFIDCVFRVMAKAPQHTFQVLTKRAARMAEYCGRRWDAGDKDPVWHPLANVWLGVSVEDQQRADERIPHLFMTPAAVRFLSVEPMIGPIDIYKYLFDPHPHRESWPHERRGLLHWLICGGESGSKARPFDLAWARSIRDQCKSAGVSCFVKQLGSKPQGKWFGDGREIDWDFPSPINPVKDSHGGDIEEFPTDLRIREFPEVNVTTLC